LQQLPGDEDRRRGPQDRPSPLARAPAGHQRALDAEPGLPARLAGDLRLRRLPRLLQALRRRRLEERLPGGRAWAGLRDLPADRAARDDAPGGDRLLRVLPLLLDRPPRRAHHALRPEAAAPPALRAERAADRARALRAAASRRA